MSNEKNDKTLQEKILQIENMAKAYMTKDAITRYGNLKSAHKEKALQVIALIAKLASENQIKEKVTDEQFKDLLRRLEPERKETKIIRK